MKCNIFILYTNNSSHVKLYRDREEFNTHRRPQMEPSREILRPSYRSSKPTRAIVQVKKGQKAEILDSGVKHSRTLSNNRKALKN